MSSIAKHLIDKWAGNTTGLKDEYRSKLAAGVWIVEFTKVDGTPAVMECTLDAKHMPPLKEGVLDSLQQQRHESDDVLAVYALDRQGWRSFKVANVKSFYPKPEPL